MTEDELKAQSVGHIPSGLFIVTAKNENDDKIDGFLASWVQQISFNPLLVSICVKPGRPCSDLILEKKNFSINVAGDHDKTYLKHFWSGYDPEKNPFNEIPHRFADSGEVIIEGARSTILCQPIEISKPGDHHLVIAKVLGSVVHQADEKSMVHQRKHGLAY